jgi:hypothetical protein
MPCVSKQIPSFPSVGPLLRPNLIAVQVETVVAILCERPREEMIDLSKAARSRLKAESNDRKEKHTPAFSLSISGRCRHDGRVRVEVDQVWSLWS